MAGLPQFDGRHRQQPIDDERPERGRHLISLHKIYLVDFRRGTLAARPRLRPPAGAAMKLVASGKTNRKIAAELVIATRTVDSHVEHILTKLGFNSRTQIAALFAKQVPDS
ncbi:hypothetical protein GCM10010470_40840 [Saccharopolyspora taberi]|uniref:HTH luxR-type domain-containing protein n=2 Tax=Saccharopolyspora taberi TaxID=60895 RepID=A0ABN3VHH6_9PSEU